MSNDSTYFVYLLASRRNGTLYIGITNDLQRRMYEHRNKLYKGFTQRYSVHQLVYFEIFEDAYTAIVREKQLKWWRRKWKMELIERYNPDWIDLVEENGEILALPRA